MALKWIIALVVTIVYLILRYTLRDKDKGGLISVDLPNLFARIILLVLYLVFWIVWLIIF